MKQLKTLLLVLGTAIALLVAAAPASARDFDCSDFSTQAQAQRYLLKGDPYRLDSNSDGVACESLPCPCSNARPGGDSPPPPKQVRFSGRVMDVVDGDTIDVRRAGRSTVRVRILGIDTPEVYGGVECGGRSASALMKRLARGRVRVATDPGQPKRDRYGRLLAYVSRDGRDLGRAMVLRGRAKVYVVGSRFSRYRSYMRAQQIARADARGSWGTCGSLRSSPAAAAGPEVGPRAEPEAGPEAELAAGPRTAPENAPRAAPATGPRAGVSIIGGKGTSIASVPWQVALVKRGNGSTWDRQFCGGTLVAPTVVVTAAHCILDDLGRESPVASYRVVSGRSYLNSVAQGASTAVVDSIIWSDDRNRPLYEEYNREWDVAVLELATPAAGEPIQIAGESERSLWATGRLGRISGWGVSNDSPFGSNRLMSTEVALLPDSSCRRAYRNFYGGFRPATQLCAGRALGRHDTCQGDSGGPLVAYAADGTARLVGITSFGKGCARKYAPGIYTRVAADPVRNAVGVLIATQMGFDVLGNDAEAPDRLSTLAARENAWLYLEPDCYQWGACVNYSVRACWTSGSGHRCTVNENALRPGGSRFHCYQRVFIGVSDGAIVREPASEWNCRRGWR